MSRARVLSGRASAETEQAMTDAWHRFIDTVRGMERQDRGDEMDRRGALSQKAQLETAIEQITTLIELRRAANGGETPRTSPSGDAAQTPPSGMKRKRRPSVSASPAPQSQAAELASHPSPQVRGGTPARDLKRARSDVDLLPLRPGRKIVVKQKTGAHGGKGKDEEEGDWILGIVRKAVGDKRYEVQDADDTSLRWTARLRDILLLPDPDAPVSSSSHPSNLEDFPRGTQVLALYPETTSFYRATVVSPPIPGTGMGRTARGARPDASAKAGQYRLAFVDDGDSVLDVDKGFVIMHPGDR